MDWKGRPESDNVEVDVLGERGKASDPVAWRCYLEVSAMRSNYMKGATSDEDRDRRQAVYSCAWRDFRSAQEGRDGRERMISFLFTPDSGQARMQKLVKNFQRDMPAYLDMYDGRIKRGN